MLLSYRFPFYPTYRQSALVLKRIEDRRCFLLHDSLHESAVVSGCLVPLGLNGKRSVVWFLTLFMNTCVVFYRWSASMVKKCSGNKNRPKRRVHLSGTRLGQWSSTVVIGLGTVLEFQPWTNLKAIVDDLGLLFTSFTVFLLFLRMINNLRRYGVAGVLSYGLLNTVYYLVTFLFVWYGYQMLPALGMFLQFLASTAFEWCFDSPFDGRKKQ